LHDKASEATAKHSSREVLPFNKNKKQIQSNSSPLPKISAGTHTAKSQAGFVCVFTGMRAFDCHCVLGLPNRCQSPR
jgi:hypothetical protein